MKPDTNSPNQEPASPAYNPASLEMSSTQVQNSAGQANTGQNSGFNNSGVINATSASQEFVKPKKNNTLMRFHKLSFIVTGAVLLFTLLSVAGGLYFAGSQTGQDTKNSKPKVDDFAVSSLKVQNLSPSQELQFNQAGELDVNGQLKVNNTIVLMPMAQPSNAVTGELYYNQINNQPYYYNGKQFISLSSQGVSSVQGQNGAVNFSPGSGITLN
jgi:hypothetical protein